MYRHETSGNGLTVTLENTETGRTVFLQGDEAATWLEALRVAEESPYGQRAIDAVYANYLDN